MARFDDTQKMVFSAVQNLFGDALTWVSSIDQISQTALVLYNSPEVKGQLGDTDKYDYSPYNYSFEYFENQLIGLKLSVDSGKTEVVTIKGKTLCVREVTLKRDGKNLIAYCDEYSE